MEKNATKKQQKNNQIIYRINWGEIFSTIVDNIWNFEREMEEIMIIVMPNMV